VRYANKRGRDVGLHEGVVQGGLFGPTIASLAADLGRRRITATTALTPSCWKRKDDMRKERGLASPDDGDGPGNSPSPIRWPNAIGRRSGRFDEGLARLQAMGAVMSTTAMVAGLDAVGRKACSNVGAETSHAPLPLGGEAWVRGVMQETVFRADPLT